MHKNIFMFIGNGAKTITSPQLIAKDMYLKIILDILTEIRNPEPKESSVQTIRITRTNRARLSMKYLLGTL